jgi:hypothetical protein
MIKKANEKTCSLTLLVEGVRQAAGTPIEAKSKGVFVSNTTLQDNNLYPSQIDVGSNSNYCNPATSKCMGKCCKNLGRTFLKIKYINKTGYFCNKCAEDLLDGLAVRLTSKDAI